MYLIVSLRFHLLSLQSLVLSLGDMEIYCWFDVLSMSGVRVIPPALGVGESHITASLPRAHMAKYRLA